MRPIATATLAVIPLLVLAGASAEGTYTATSFCAWEQAVLDVVIVPPFAPAGVHHEGDTITLPATGLVPFVDPAAPWDAAHARATVDAIATWSAALDDLARRAGHEHLAGLELRVTMAGPDTDPAVVQGADIGILFTPAQDAGGRTVMSCTSATSSPIAGNSISPGIGQWIVMNQWFVLHFTPQDTYNIMLHEFGHALGLEHIDAPAGDTMNPVYPHIVGNVENPRECLSNLDALQAAVGWQWLDGVTPYAPEPPATTIPASAYAKLC